MSILRILARGEKRILSLVVAVRRESGRAEPLKGDLTSTVLLTLRKMIADGQVRESDGIYALR